MQFSAATFRECFSDPAKIQQKLNPYLLNCKAHNASLIYSIIQQFYKILTDNKESTSPKLKVNAVFALQFVIEICQYEIITLMEVYLLPHLLEIALYASQNRTYAKTSQYFKEKGYLTNTPNLEQFSHNFVIISTDLLFLLGQIKSKRYFFGEPMDQPSDYKSAVIKLKNKGLEQKEDQKSKADKLKKMFEKKINEFQSNYCDSYIQFFKKKIESYLISGIVRKELLDYRKLLRYGDNFISSDIIGLCSEMLEQNNFLAKRNALILIHQFVSWGDVEAIMMINFGQTIQNVANRISEIKGHSSISKGAQIYPEVQGQHEQKKSFYIEFLKCLESWAACLPTYFFISPAQKDQSIESGEFQISKVKELYNFLKIQKQFIFPENSSLGKFKKDFELNLSQNQERNEYILMQLNEGTQSNNLQTSKRVSSKYTNQISLIKEMKESTILTFSELEKFVLSTEQMIQHFAENQKQLNRKVKKLSEFDKEFDKKFIDLEEEIQEEKIEELYNRGYRCIEEIKIIKQAYESYQKNQIKFKELFNHIELKCEQIRKSLRKQSSKEKVSLNAKSKLKMEKSKQLSSHSHQQQKDRTSEILRQSYQKAVKSKLSKENLSKSGLSLSKSRSQDIKYDESKDILHDSKANKKLNENNQGNKVIISSKLNGSSMLTQKEKEVFSDEQSSSFVIQSQSNFKQNHRSQKGTEENKQNLPKQELMKLKNNSSQDAENQFQPLFIKQSKNNKGSHNNAININDNDKGSHINAINLNNNNYQQKVNPQQKQDKQQFENVSFSKYSSSNEELKEIIDKSDNPDFNLIFRNRSVDHQNNSSSQFLKSHITNNLNGTNNKASQLQQNKVSLLRSVDQSHLNSNFHSNNNHFQGVIESLAPRSANSSLDRIDKEKSLSKYSNVINHALKDGKHNSKIKLERRSEEEGEEPGDQLNTNKKKDVFIAINNYEDKVYFDHKYQQQRSIHQKIENQSKSQRSSRVDDEKKMQQIQMLQRRIKQLQADRIKSSREERSQKMQEDQHYGEVQVVRDEYASPLRPAQFGSMQSPKYRTNTSSSPNNFYKKDYELQTRQTLISPHNKVISTNLQNSEGFNGNRKANTFYKNHNFENNLDSFRSEQEINYNKKTDKKMYSFDVVNLFERIDGRLMHSQQYKKYLTKLSGHLKEQKKILKANALIYRDILLQVGVTIHLQRNTLKIIYFITANKELRQFHYCLEEYNDKQLKMQCIPREIGSLSPNKQYKIYIFAEVLQFPYTMPSIRFKYSEEEMTLQERMNIAEGKTTLQERMNIAEGITPAANTANRNAKIYVIRDMIPVYFSKFITIQKINSLRGLFSMNKSKIIRGEEVPYNHKFIKKHKEIQELISQNLQLETQVQQQQGRQMQGAQMQDQNEEDKKSKGITTYEHVYCGLACYLNIRFALRIHLKINKFMCIQCLLVRKSQTQGSHEGEYVYDDLKSQQNEKDFISKLKNREKILEFYITCLNQLLIKNILE